MQNVCEYLQFPLQTGHMTTSTGSYLIKPAKHWSDYEETSTESSSSSSSLQHAIYRTPSADLTLTNDLPRNHECGVIGTVYITGCGSYSHEN